MAKKSKKTLTKAEEKAYLKNPGSCPKCKSGNITGDSFEANDNKVWQTVICEDCGFKWMDEFTLTNIFQNIEELDKSRAT